MITTNLISGYHRDLQLVKESFLPAFDTLKQVLSIATYSLQHIIVNQQIVEDPKYAYLFTVEAVNKEVLQGVPFRDAYRKVGQQIAEGTYTADLRINHTHEGSIGNLCNDKIREKMEETISTFRFEEAYEALGKLLS